MPEVREDIPSESAPAGFTLWAVWRRNPDAPVVETEATGTLTCSSLFAGLAGSSRKVPEAPVKSPYQVEKPMCATEKRMRVWLGSTL